MNLLHKGLYIKRLLKQLDIKEFRLHDRNDPLYVGFGKNTLINLLKLDDFEKESDQFKAKSILDVIKAPEEAYNFILPKSTKSNARDIGHHLDEDIESDITEISPGYYLLTTELVPVQAQAGYLAGYQDQEFIETLPKYRTTVSRYARGKYRHFEASGDSMDNGDIREAIPDGTILMCREIKHDLWSSKLHTHKWPNYIFVHRTEGVIVKQIAHQDLTNGVLVLHSLNPNKDKYPDFEVNLDDILEIYNVVKRILE